MDDPANRQRFPSVVIYNDLNNMHYDDTISSRKSKPRHTDYQVLMNFKPRIVERLIIYISIWITMTEVAWSKEASVCGFLLYKLFFIIQYVLFSKDIAFVAVILMIKPVPNSIIKMKI